MRRHVQLILTVIVLFFSGKNALKAQADSCDLQISLLTCTPGAELYSTFGHTAIRVKSVTFDIVYNYGTFEFDDPDFYSKFVKGKLPYFLSVEQYADFAYSYLYEKRGIEEQVLLLNCNAKQKLFDALKKNAQEENKFYRYDFLFDNCTTRAGDIITANCGDSVLFNSILLSDIPTFRQLLYQYLDNGQQDWSKLGIDILLGSRLDRKVTNKEAMFLPDNLKKGMNVAFMKKERIATNDTVILASTAGPVIRTFWTPFLIFSLLFLVIAILSFIKNKVANTTLVVFDRLWFLVTGLLGILLLYMWMGTDHAACRDNWNLVWAFPLHTILIFLNWRKEWVRKYFQYVFIISTLTILCWAFLPQQLNTALLPIVAITGLRSYFRWKA